MCSKIPLGVSRKYFWWKKAFKQEEEEEVQKGGTVFCVKPYQQQFCKKKYIKKALFREVDWWESPLVLAKAGGHWWSEANIGEAISVETWSARNPRVNNFFFMVTI